VRADFERAGFVLEAQSDLLAVPGDDHSKNVFDPAIRGRTDRFVYRFRRP
jgi:predicted methyltransferase